MDDLKRGGLPLVSVVVPAYQAEATIRATLASVVAQTYPNLQIVVVDDGSRDRTADIAAEFAAADPRVTVIRRANGGASAARNSGIAASSGEFIAPIDADDIWHPRRVEAHVRALLNAGPEVALAYSPYRLIDRDDRIIRSYRRYDLSGQVVHRLPWFNMIANGSGFTVRRSAAEEVGGFQDWLRDESLEGNEDLYFQIEVATRHHFVAVPEYLVGYRMVEGSISDNHRRMWTSRARTHQVALRRYPALRNLPYQISSMPFVRNLFSLDIRRKGFGAALRQALLWTGRFPLTPIALPLLTLASTWRKLARIAPEADPAPELVGKAFLDVDPAVGRWFEPTGLERLFGGYLERLDASYEPRQEAAGPRLAIEPMIGRKHPAPQ